MKKLGKAVLGLVAAVAMLVTGLVAPLTAVAAGEYTITITNSVAGYTYEAYQVFKGDLSEDKTTLSNIEWGAGLDSTKTAELLTKLKDDDKFKVGSANIFANADTAAKVAKALGDNTKDDSPNKDVISKEFAKVVGGYLSTTAQSTARTQNEAKTAYEISGLDAGYYLVKNSQVPAGDYSYTDFIMEVVKSVTVVPKGNVPTVEKKVKDINDSTDTTKSEWQDSADHDINDIVDYQLTGTLPTNFDSYDKYKYEFTDTLSAGLTLNHIEVKDSDPKTYTNDVAVYVKNDNTETKIATGYTLNAVEDTKNALAAPYAGGTTLTITFANLKDAKGENGADLTINSNSKIVVRYTAQLNEKAQIGSAGNPNKVKLTFFNNPNNTGEGAPTGDTPEDTVIVFTFKLDVTKYSEEIKDANKLVGAGFTLYKYNAKSTAAKEEDKYEPVKPFTDNTISEGAKENEILAKEGSSFNFKGLDDGKYMLKETTTPTGYNTIDPIYFTVEAEHETNMGDSKDTPKLKNLVIKDVSGKVISGENLTFGTDVSTGDITTGVINKKGSNLPSTGGMGTVILYALGAAFVAAAGAWFAFRRRLSNR